MAYKITKKYKDKTVTRIYQDNGWVCIITIWNDGTYEEEYEKDI